MEERHEEVIQEQQEVVQHRTGPGFEDLPGAFPKEVFSVLAGEGRNRFALPYMHLETIPVLAQVRKEDRGVLFLGGVPIVALEYEDAEGREVRKVSYKTQDVLSAVKDGGSLKILAGIHKGITIRRPDGKFFVVSLPFGSSYVGVIRSLFATGKPSVRGYLDFRREFLRRVYGGEEQDLKESVQKQAELFAKVVEENKTDIARAVVNAMLTTVTTEEGDEVRIVKRNIHWARYTQGKGYVISLLPLPSGDSTPVLPFSPLHRAVEEVVEYTLGRRESLALNKQFEGLFKGLEENKENYRTVLLAYLTSLKQTWKELRELQTSGVIKKESLSFMGRLSVAYSTLLTQEILNRAGLLQPEVHVEESLKEGPAQEVEAELGVEEDFFDLAQQVREMALKGLSTGAGEDFELKF